MSDLFHEQLEALRGQSLQRRLREIGTAQGPQIQIVGHELANFSSDDYLGLANDERLRAAATAAIAEFGVGAGASRLISGTQTPHVRLEAALARWQQAPAAIAFSSGYATCVGTIPALVGKQDVVVLDRLCHAALIDGAKLSGAIVRVYPHNHLGKLESHLAWAREEHPEARLLIVTESIFANEGDRVPLRALTDLKKRFRALLLLDESHALGVIGPQGRGVAAEEKLEVDVHLGSLSKALGGSGGYVCGSRGLIEWLVNRARSFIFSTAPAPALAAAATSAIDFLGTGEGETRRQQLWKNIELLRASWPPDDRAGDLPEHVPASPAAAIHLCLIGREAAARELARALQTEGFLVPAIRYPTVAKGIARLRVTVTAAHHDAQILGLCEALARLRKLPNE